MAASRSLNLNTRSHYNTITLGWPVGQPTQSRQTGCIMAEKPIVDSIDPLPSATFGFVFSASRLEPIVLKKTTLVLRAIDVLTLLQHVVDVLQQSSKRPSNLSRLLIKTADRTLDSPLPFRTLYESGEALGDYSLKELMPLIGCMFLVALGKADKQPATTCFICLTCAAPGPA